MRKLAFTLLSVAALAAPGAASAATTINGTLAANLSRIRSSSGSLSAGAVLSNAGSTVDDPEQQFTLVPVNTPITLSAITATVGRAVTFTSAFGAFTGTVSSLDFSTISGNKYLQILSLGTFTPQGVLRSFNGGPASLTFSFSQGARAGSAISGSFTLSSPPASPVPEPGVWTMMITGAGFAGYAVRRRNRKPTAEG